MILLLQRVLSASVSVNEQCIATINQGILVLVGVDQQDNANTVRKACDKLLHYRIFADQEDKMNLSAVDINAELLLVPQFTLLADTTKGLRPSLGHAAGPTQAKSLFTHLVQCTTEQLQTQQGEFGANMQVNLCNDGPVTFWLDIR